MSEHDPMFDSIPRYTMLVKVDYMGAGTGIAAEPNPDGGWINAADLPALIAKVREDEGNRYDGMAVVHWDAGHAWGLHDAEVTSRKQSLRKGLWIGWAIGTLLMLIPLIVFVVTQ